ncbi:hypothetical protein ACNJUF_21235, partial [Mycobacterium tuberculosis]
IVRGDKAAGRPVGECGDQADERTMMRDLGRMGGLGRWQGGNRMRHGRRMERRRRGRLTRRFQRDPRGGGWRRGRRGGMG